MKDKYLRFSDFIYKVCENISKTVLVCMATSIIIAVVSRFLPVRTPKWTNEIGIICMVWLCFLTASLALKNGSHIRVTIIDYLLPKKINKILSIAVSLLMLVLFIMLSVSGIDLLIMTHSNTLSTTGLPSSIMYGAVGVSSIFGLFFIIDKTIRENL